jgi:hypothetical protein
MIKIKWFGFKTEVDIGFVLSTGCLKLWIARMRTFCLVFLRVSIVRFDIREKKNNIVIAGLQLPFYFLLNLA